MVAARVRKVAGLISRYLTAMAIGAAVVGAFTRGYTTPLMFVLGAAIGVVAMAVVETCINARYMLANRALAKSRRRREAQRKPPAAPMSPR
jgi:hypothetical protein